MVNHLSIIKKRMNYFLLSNLFFFIDYLSDHSIMNVISIVIIILVI